MKLRTKQRESFTRGRIPLKGAKIWLSITPVRGERPPTPSEPPQIMNQEKKPLEALSQCPLAEVPLAKLFLIRAPVPTAL